MVDRVSTRMKAEEFLALPETNTPMELIEGEVIVSPTPVPRHQQIIRRIDHHITPIVEKLGGEIYLSPLDVYLDEDNVVQPDLMWLAPDSQCKVGEKHLIGAPEFVVEVLSPRTARRDKVAKFRLYERFAVREYWIADPENLYIEVHTLREGKFHHLGTFQSGETFKSPVFGDHGIDVTAIFGKTGDS